VNSKEIDLLKIAEYASNRTELYEKLSKVYDLPNLNGVVSLDYLKELINKDSKYFKIKRKLTRTLPVKNYRKVFDSKDTLKVLKKLLKKHNQKPSGFST
jgi:hypothetical protein